MEKQSTETYHRFLDEAGDTTFYGKGKIPILGHEGVSYCFILGMITINETLDKVRKQVIDLQESISNDTYFTEIPSIQKKKKAHGYFLHAKDDIPEVRKYVAVDGGMTDNIRPALYKAQYQCVIVNKVSEPSTEVVTIAGKCCESGDILLENVKLPKVDSGDKVDPRRAPGAGRCRSAGAHRGGGRTLRRTR